MIRALIRVFVDGAVRLGGATGPTLCLPCDPAGLLAFRIDREVADGIRDLEAMLRQQTDGRT